MLGKCPTVSFWCQTATIPSVQGHIIEQATPFGPAKVSLSRVLSGPLTLTFLVDESLTNYREIYDWLRGIGAPTGFDDFLEWQASHPGALGINDLPGVTTSDAVLIVNDSNNNPLCRVKFPAVVPTNLGSLTFDTRTTDTFLTCTAAFATTFFTIEI